jgi:hypothetical protein
MEKDGLSVTYEELVAKLISMGYTEQKARKIAKSKEAFRSQLAKDNPSSSNVEAQQDFSAMHEGSVVSRINEFVKR